MSGTLSGYRERLSPHHQDGSTTKRNERDNLHQTVLPLLANNKKDALQAFHTSAVNRAIDNMTDKRVLNNRPPPINDEETQLARRQRATLSQLRSGHCKLLYSYKKRLKLTESSSCPDCGIVPQYIPHLFCTAHPTYLSPVNLWDKPVRTIRKLSFIHLENLDKQDEHG